MSTAAHSKTRKDNFTNGSQIDQTMHAKKTADTFKRYLTTSSGH